MLHKKITKNYKRIMLTVKFGPQLLTQVQRDNCVTIYKDLFDHANEDENFMTKIITGNEMWVYGFHVETKLQSSQ